MQEQNPGAAPDRADANEAAGWRRRGRRPRRCAGPPGPAPGAIVADMPAYVTSKEATQGRRETLNIRTVQQGAV